MKVNIKTGKRPRIEMLPLIDIVFLLLVFFIYAMLSMAVHKGLPVTLPSSSTAEITRGTPISVTLKADGSIYLDKSLVSHESIAHELQAKIRGDKKSSVLLFADKTVNYQSIFKIMDKIRGSGITDISLQAEVD